MAGETSTVTEGAQQMDHDYWASLEQLEDLKPNRSAKAAAKEERYPCERCGGSGRYRGARIHQPKSHCFQCGGKGYFKTSPHARMKARQQAAARKVAKVEKNWESFASEHADLATFLQSVTDKSDFAGPMIDAVRKFGHLTERQLIAAENMRYKWQAAAEQRQKERKQRAENAPEIDLGKIIDAMTAAYENGVKRPKIRLECGTLSRAPMTGKNPGAIYFKQGETYLGKIAPEGRFFRSRACSDETEAQLVEAANDPLASMVAYGRKTGSCSCCGRELTNKQPIELGIGPICRGKFGLASSAPTQA